MFAIQTMQTAAVAASVFDDCQHHRGAIPSRPVRNLTSKANCSKTVVRKSNDEDNGNENRGTKSPIIKEVVIGGNTKDLLIGGNQMRGPHRLYS